MGMYTEIYVNVNLKPETPKDVIDKLQAMCGDNDMSVLIGCPDRWAYLFKNGSYYVPSTSCAHLFYDDRNSFYSFLGKGDIKNYEQEIEQFFDWIMPYVAAEEGLFIGYKRYEEDLLPTIIVKKGD